MPKSCVALPQESPMSPRTIECRIAWAALAMRALLGACAVASCAVAVAQDAYPNRSVKSIAPQPPRGGVDLVARIIAEKLPVGLGPTFWADNTASAGRPTP